MLVSTRVAWFASLTLALVLICGLYFSRSLWIPLVAGDRAGTEDHHDDDHAHDDYGDGDDAHDDHAHDQEAHDEHEESIILSNAAASSLGLETAPVARQDFVKWLLIPSMVVELPGVSTVAVSATANGIVDRISIAPGQALPPGKPLLTLRFTGDAMANAQAELLRTLARQDSLKREIDRVEPLVTMGTVPEKTLIELDNDRREIEAFQQTTVQQLLMLGLFDAQIEMILKERKIVREVTVRTPPLPTKEGIPTEAASASDREKHDFTVETLGVHPGQRVKAGDLLCKLAYHRVLMVEGYAFKQDLPKIRKVMEGGQQVAVDFGEHDKHGGRVEKLRLLYVNNHVDPSDNTFRVYAVLPNEVLSDIQDEDGRIYRSWRYRPGQRAHLLVPEFKKVGQLVVPASAVLENGLEHCVFRKVVHSEHADHGEVEFERVAVNVLNESRDLVVVADGELKVDDIVVTRRGYLLLNEQRMDTTGGGHNHHHH